ncbi:putative NADH-dependent oxidoreductase [Gordonia namibiensis NBRC 108229]|uniref:Putative NADH-dependent oxidoreductase n=1 Tax=Gordonia namibiensis NBRC 108229 TaxID=1208314 RepID=K6WQB4_9ACTN|nr:FAD-dependent oxidoreductase [Gordonia namibiensis]GAC01621.1 putative NADH-dependent oxidoreductase [Gordonia namibiensis NBRC 108229]
MATTATHYPHLFTPGRIGELEVENRILKSPQSTATANADGTVSARTVEHYKRLGQGGIGLVMMEYSFIDSDASKAIHNQLGNAHREHTPGLGWVVDEVHATGARIGLQIAHGGRQKFLGTAPIKSATDSSWSDVEGQYGVVPTPMTVDEIDAVVAAFGDAAARAHAARFDIVEVHAGHGYLITNFLSPHTNWREDEYGGSFDNRARLLLRIVDDIRAKVPREFPLSIRLSVTDYEPDGIPIEETVELCRRLEARGVDVLHCSGGHHAGMEWEVSPWYQVRTPHRWGWEKIKAAVSIPVIASGSIVSPETAEEILASGSADFVSLGRPMLADPDWARKAKLGRALEITPCIRCNDGCLHRGLNKGRSVGCSVNPSVAEEGRFPVTTAETSKVVAVIGGGPAGLHAAAVLHDRGHGVTLYEPGELGGLLNHAQGSTVKQDLAALARHLVHEVTRRDIPIVTRAADAQTITSGHFDAAVVATGALAESPRFPIGGSVPVITAAQIRSADAPRGRVVIVGGGLQGCEAALRISESAAAAGDPTTVTILEANDGLLAGDEVFTDVERLPLFLDAAGVSVRCGHTVVGIDDEGLHVETADAAETIAADTVVLALGRQRPDSDLADELEAAGIEVRVIGSARQPGRVFDAMHTAFFAARSL